MINISEELIKFLETFPDNDLEMQALNKFLHETDVPHHLGCESVLNFLNLFMDHLDEPRVASMRDDETEEFKGFCIYKLPYEVRKN